jgi:hypothetical protein
MDPLPINQRAVRGYGEVKPNAEKSLEEVATEQDKVP